MIKKHHLAPRIVVRSPSRPPGRLWFWDVFQHFWKFFKKCEAGQKFQKKSFCGNFKISAGRCPAGMYWPKLKKYDHKSSPGRRNNVPATFSATRPPLVRGHFLLKILQLFNKCCFLVCLFTRSAKKISPAGIHVIISSSFKPFEKIIISGEVRAEKVLAQFVRISDISEIPDLIL